MNIARIVEIKPISFDSGFPCWRVRMGPSLAQDDSCLHYPLGATGRFLAVTMAFALFPMKCPFCGFINDKVVDSRESKTSEIGELIINRLKKFDKVAYVRFASVYLDFKDVKEFMAELKHLLKAKEPAAARGKLGAKA